MAGRKGLLDLYKVGDYVSVTGPVPDGSTQTFRLWLQKPAKPDMETVLRRAGAAQAVKRMAKDSEESEEYLSTYNEVVDGFGDHRDTMVTYLTTMRRLERYPIVSAQVAGEDPESEWAKEDYFKNLQDAWMGVGDDDLGLRAVWAADNENPEAKRVFEEMERFANQVDVVMDAEEVHIRGELESETTPGLLHLLTLSSLDDRGISAWHYEYSRTLLFLACRDEDSHEVRYFDEMAEVDLLDPTVRDELIARYDKIAVTVTEGKDSRATPASSESSDSSDAEAISDSSGHLAAAT